MPEPHLRAADTDRTAVATLLGEHMAAGRLTLAEYEERVSRAYAARTYGELDELTADLPRTAPSDRRAPAAGPVAPTPGTRSAARPGPTACGAGPWQAWGGAGSLRAAWGSWASTAVIVLVVWLATSVASGELHYPWPVWVIGPWGLVLLAQTVGGRRDDPEPAEHRLHA